MLQVLKTYYYAGIGSRETPPEVRNTMMKISNAFSRLHMILRSGGADGADTAFECGCVNDSKEIWLPWKGFNKNPSRFYLPEDLNNPHLIEIAKVAREYHPRWNALSMGGKRMMMRNVIQVLGYQMDSPVEFVACWTKDGGPTGGTGQAIRIACDRGIRVYNIFHAKELEELRECYKYLREKMRVERI